MPEPVIRVEALGKRYRIGRARRRHDTLRDALVAGLRAPLRRLSPSVGRRSSGGPGRDEETLWALKDVSFEVQRGEVVGIIGRNGAGKSTLLKILSRITHPTEGRAEIEGRVGSLLEVGTGFHPELTGRENIYLNGAILGMRKAEIERRFDEIVAFAEIERFLDTPVKRYSSGMYVRLAFAVAAHLEPEILLVDEVLAVGDVAFQNKCLGKMGNVAKQGRTVLFVSHNMAAVQQLCSVGLLLQDGRMEHFGATGESIDRYLGFGSGRLGSILSHAVYSDSVVRLHTLSINGSSNDLLNLSPACRQLDIAASGWLNRPMSLILEARIYDNTEQCLAFFTPRQSRLSFESFPAGEFSLSESIALPHLNRGEYYLSLYLAEADRQGVSPVQIHKGVRLVAEGTPTVTGWVFKYARGNGWMLLPSACETREVQESGSCGSKQPFSGPTQSSTYGLEKEGLGA
jgi:lipopolysaccharide transport system ATP-binding protein